MKSTTYVGAVCKVFWWVGATENEERLKSTHFSAMATRFGFALHSSASQEVRAFTLA